MSKAVVAEGTVERWGTQVARSADAWSKPGWRLRTVKASAQLSVEPWLAVWSVALFLMGRSVSDFTGLVAARVLQKSVLVGLERHWVQVPGSLMQGFEVTA